MAGGDKDEYGNLPSWNIVVICTVGGVLFFEHICHQLNHAAHGKKHAMELLDGLYRELAILGVVAFVLWSINVSEYSDIEYNDKHMFEMIHMTLFLAAIFHSFFVGLVAYYSRNINRRWDIFEDDEMRRYKDLKLEHRRTAQLLGIRHSSLKRGVGFWRMLWLNIRHPIHSRRLSALNEHVSYHALRSQFIKDNQLPKNFRFAAYLQKCEQDVVIELAGIKHSVWVGFILFVGIELFVKGLMGEAESDQDVRVLFLVIAALVMLAALAVYFKIINVYNTLVHSYTASTDRREGIMQFLGGDSTSYGRHQDLFWFGNPSLMLLAIQSMQFLLAVMVGALVWFGTGDSTGLVILGEAILAVGALVVYGLVLPKFIPKYTKITHVGSMVNRHILSETLKKQKANFKRRALPPTLRQVSVMARVKANESNDNKKLAWIRKMMSGHGFREFVLVIIGIHFFLVAYNVDPVEKGDDTSIVWIAEMVFAGIALAVEATTHFIVWRGKACFNCKPFLNAEDASAMDAQSVPDHAAVVYPSTSKRHLLDDKGDAAGDVGDLEKGKASKASAVADMKPLAVDPSSSAYATGRRFSIWACFGWTGGSPGGSCFSVPPEAAVGFYRTIDILLVLVITGCAIATGLVDGTTREIIHAIQGIVLLRMWPLFKCPLPPAEGHGNLHDIDGAKVHHAPLDEASREQVLQETLRLLRGQAAPEGTFAARALVATTSDSVVDADMDDKQNALTKQPNDVVDLMKHKGPIQEEKDKDFDHGEEQGHEIANVGVAMALREACAAHPELVQSHGPLSAPILRAMLGLDPYKTDRQDNTEALAVAAKAVALARGLDRSGADRTPNAAAMSEAGGGGARFGRQTSAVPSAAGDSASSVSDLSSSEEEDAADHLRRDRTTSGVRGRLNSWLGGGGGGPGGGGISTVSRHQLREKQQLAYQQQQELHFRMQLQHQREQLKQFQFQQYQQRHQHEAALLENTALAAPALGLHLAPLLGANNSLLFQSSTSSLDPSREGLLPPTGMAFGGGGEAVLPTGAASWHHPPSFGPGGFSFAAGGRMAKKPSSVTGARSNTRPRGRSRTSRRPGSSARSESGVMAAAIEDIERPVLPSIVSSNGNGSQHGTPFSSGHPRTRAHSRGTPSRGSRQRFGSRTMAVDSASVSNASGVGEHLYGIDSGGTVATTSSSAASSTTPRIENRVPEKRE